MTEQNETKRTLTWLHFSDLHLCHPRTGWEVKQILEMLKKDLLDLQKDFELCPDLIFFTGDAVFGHLGEGKGKSIEDQFIEAEILFDEIRELFDPSVPKKNFFIVPGNHEVNRQEAIHLLNEGLASSLGTKSHEEIEKYLSQLIREKGSDWQGFMKRLSNYRKFLKDFGYKHLLKDPDRLIYAVEREINGLKIGVAGLNSSWSCYQNGEKGNLWLAGHWQIQTLKNDLEAADLKIVLMHHPPNWFSLAEDRAVEQAIENHFDFFLHGHEHQGWVTNHANGFTRIASGAGYGDSEKETGYNLVQLDLDQGQGKVWLRKYNKDGGMD